MVQRIQLSDEVREFLLDGSQMPAKITVGHEEYTLDRPAGWGFKSVVWKVTNRYGRPRALKLAISEDYQERSFLEEVQRALELESYEVFARLNHADIVDLEVPGDQRLRFVGFVEDWIDGYTLQEFLKRPDPDVSSSFLVSYVAALTSALSVLQSAGLRHDDLHAGNVMISEPPEGELTVEYKIKIIDMGSLKPADTPTTKQKDDHQHLVEHIVEIHNAIHSKRSLPIRERRFLAETEHLVRSMLEEDPSVRLQDPARIKQEFELAVSRASAPVTSSDRLLTSPFEFLSAEHIADDRLLVEMFAKSCPWLEKGGHCRSMSGNGTEGVAASQRYSGG